MWRGYDARSFKVIVEKDTLVSYIIERMLLVVGRIIGDCS